MANTKNTIARISIIEAMILDFFFDNIIIPPLFIAVDCRYKIE